jgi:hypothetical protein
MRTSLYHANRNGTRWSNPDHLNRDLDKIIETTDADVLRRNRDPQATFYRWLERTVKPETIDAIMSSEHQYSISFSAWRLLVQRHTTKAIA